MDWNEFFMNMVYLVSMKSKDESFQLGAVIVGNDNEVLSIGFNGICRNVNDNKLARDKRPEKYFGYEHAEQNAIYNAAHQGICTKQATMFTNGMPCMDCARAIIQSGILVLVIDNNFDIQTGNEKWKESCGKAEGMLEEAGIKIMYYDFKKPVVINPLVHGVKRFK